MVCYKLKRLVTNILNWIKVRKDELHTLSAVVGVLVSLALSLTSLWFSCQAKNETQKLKADAERVEVYFEAKFENQEKIELILPDNMRRFPVLVLYAHLTIYNLNPYRPIIIEGVEFAFADGSMPSELSMKLIDGDEAQSTIFVVSSLSVARKRVRLSWPIDDTLCEFTKLLLERRPHLTCGDLALEIGKTSAVFQVSKQHRQIVFSLKTVPKGRDGKEFTAALPLY